MMQTKTELSKSTKDAAKHTYHELLVREYGNDGE